MFYFIICLAIAAIAASVSMWCVLAGARIVFFIGFAAMEEGFILYSISSFFIWW